MAGDWIKMRTNLRTHPKVVRMASALKADRLRVIGGLHAVWCLFDAHSADGRLDGYTEQTLDEDIAWPGFSAAMVAVDWLENDGDSLATPRFDEHNGQSAKRRAQEAERKRNDRKTSASDADKKRTREEKRREEENPMSGPSEPDADSLGEEKVERRKVRRGSDADYECAEFLFKQQRKANPTCKAPNFDTWANDIRLMREQDGRQLRDICELFKWAKSDDFWSPNIQSPAKLREKWDVLHERRTRENPPPAPVKKDWE